MSGPEGVPDIPWSWAEHGRFLYRSFLALPGLLSVLGFFGWTWWPVFPASILRKPGDPDYGFGHWWAIEVDLAAAGGAVGLGAWALLAVATTVWIAAGPAERDRVVRILVATSAGVATLVVSLGILGQVLGPPIPPPQPGVWITGDKLPPGMKVLPEDAPEP